MALFHFTSDALQTDRGAGLANWRVQIVAAGTSTVQPIYSDINGTPILAVSLITNTAVSDHAGNYDFFCNEGVYDLMIYNDAGVFQRRKTYVSMYGAALALGSLPYVTPEMFGAKRTAGVDDRAAIQAAIDYATTNGIPEVRLSGTYEAWCTAKTTSRYGYSDDGHLLVIKGSVAIIGTGTGATINRKGVNGVAGSQQTLPVGGGAEGLWRGGGFYWSHSANVTQNTVVVMKNFKLDGGLNQGTPGPNASPMFTVNGWDDTDKGIWVQGQRSGTLIMEDVEITRFRGEINYWAGQSDLTSTDTLIMNRCWLHVTDGSADNSQGGTAKFYNCRFGEAYGPTESLGRSGKSYNDCEFYSAAGGSTFIGGPDPDFDGVHQYDYPIRRATSIPFTELNNCIFRDCGFVSIGNWTRGTITCIDTYILCGASDIDIKAEMWLDKLNAISACIIQTTATNPTDTGGYTAPISHVRFNVNLHRTKAAADAGRAWAQIFALSGAFIANTVSLTSDYADGCTYIWGAYGTTANIYTIPAIRCTEFKESGYGQRGGGTYDYPAGNIVYCPTWPAILLYPSVAQIVVTLTDTSGHQFFWDDKAKVRFINGDASGKVTIFPVGGAFLALRKPRVLAGQFDYLDLVYDKTLNKWIEADFKGQESVPVTLAYAATVTPNLGYGFDFELTLTGNATLANPTNATGGQKGTIRITQDATGTRTLAYGANWKFAGGAPTLSTAANAVDVITYEVGSNGNVYATIAKAYA